MIGVTGTQGKTTTTRLLESGLERRRRPGGGDRHRRHPDRGEDVKSALTTPEAPDLHGLFAVMRERGVEACAMEVSSHALVMGRVDGVVFDVARLHQPRPRPPRLPRRRGGLLRGQGGAVHPRARPARPGQRRRRARPAAGRAGPTIPVQTFSATGAPTPTGGPSTSSWRRTGSTFTVLGPGRRAGRRRVPLARRLQRRQRAGRDRRAGEAGFDAERGGRRDRRRPRRARAAGAGRRRPGLRGRRRLRPQARRRRGRARHPAAAHRAAG